MADVRKEKRSGMAYCLTTRRRREVVGCFRHQHCCASIFGEPKSVLFFFVTGCRLREEASARTRIPKPPTDGSRQQRGRSLRAPLWRHRAKLWRGIASPAQAPKRLRGRAPGFAPGRATVSDRSPLSLSSVWDKPTRTGPRARPLLTERAP